MAKKVFFWPVDLLFVFFEMCWCLQYTLTSCSPPVSSMLTTTTTTTTTKSWRSDTLIILPGWECHTGGSRSKPTVHRCPQGGRGCGLLAKSTTTSPMAQPQCSNVKGRNVNKMSLFILSRMSVCCLCCCFYVPRLPFALHLSKRFFSPACFVFQADNEGTKTEKQSDPI